jgi:UDP-GlcNAc:undecaprenyl-phosphate GlcNAc-1-phosphate transferase
VKWLDFSVIFAVAGVTVGVLTPLVSRLCYRLLLLDRPGEHKQHRFPTPNLGGIAVFIAIWLAFLCGYLKLPGIDRELGRLLYYLLAGGAIMFLIGIIDDLRHIPALWKLILQTATGLFLYVGGLQIVILFVPFVGPVMLGWLSLPVTLLWLLGVTNSINLIDGVDGLAAGVAAIAALAIFFVGIHFRTMTVITISLAIMGANLVFLYFNHYPARIFLGNGGALFLGYLFAVISLLFPIKTYTTAAIFVPLLALGVPISETILSFVRRTLQGQRFYQADNRHLFHYLGQAGLSQVQIVWIFYALSALFAVFSAAMFVFDKRVVFAVLVVFMVVIFAILFTFSAKFGKRKRVI